MARLIDAEALKEHVKKYMSVFAKYDWREICEMLNDAPTVEAEPIRHGHWDCKGFEPVRCSVCGITVDAINGIPWAIKGFKFCPHCGAKMDEMKVNNSKGIDLWMTKEDFNSLYEDDVEDGV